MSTEKKEERREWFLRFDDYKYKFHIAYDERKYHDDIHVVEAKWRDCAMRLAAALEAIEDCPFIVDSATVPKAGIEAAQPYQVVVNLCISWSKLKLAQQALAEFSKLSGGEGV